MRMSHEALVDRAVAVLQKAMEQARHAPVPLTPGLRLALAYLYAVSDDRPLAGTTPRHVFDEFLRAVTNPIATDMPARDARGRVAEAISAFNGICRRVGYGVEETARAEKERDRLFDAMQQVSADRRKEEAWKSRGKECPIQRPMRDRWPE